MDSQLNLYLILHFKTCAVLLQNVIKLQIFPS